MACSTVLATPCQIALRDREAIPGCACAVHERLFRAGASQRLPSGDSPSNRAFLLTSFAHKAPGRARYHSDCSLVDLSRKTPASLPGGYLVGEQLFYTGASQIHLDGGRVTYGQHCKVAGPATSGPAPGKGLCVKFEGDTQNRFCLLTSLSREAPGPLPGGYTVGERIFYAGASQTYPNGDTVMHGQSCEVAGPALSEASEACRGRRLCVRVEGCQRNIGCWLTNLSREAPGPLPGGFSVGERISYTGAGQTDPDGDQVMSGQLCEVAGPATSQAARDRGLCVKLEGGRRKLDVLLTNLARKPLGPLPGGYAIGERIFYVGTGHAYANGDEITHGQICEVVGRAGSQENPRSKRLSVKVAGCKASIVVSVTQVSRTAP